MWLGGVFIFIFILRPPGGGGYFDTSRPDVVIKKIFMHRWQREIGAVYKSVIL